MYMYRREETVPKENELEVSVFFYIATAVYLRLLLSKRSILYLLKVVLKHESRQVTPWRSSVCADLYNESH